MLTFEQKSDLFKKATVRKKLRCRFGFHSWTPVAVGRGDIRRGCIKRRACKCCGKVEMITVYDRLPIWSHWGYIHPKDAGRNFSDVISEYVSDAEKKHNESHE